MRTYQYHVLGKNKYLVRRTDNKLKRGEKKRYKEYIVDLNNGDMLCSCEGFYYSKKACKHIKFILEQMKDGGGILDFNEEIKDLDRISWRQKNE